MSLASPVPQPISDVMLAFPANVEPLMPAWDDIPQEFKGSGNGWVSFVDSWFYRGMSSKVEFHMKEGVSGEAAFRHLQAVMGSFQPKHEHKVAAVAYLSSLWFDAVVDGDARWPE